MDSCSVCPNFLVGRGRQQPFPVGNIVAESNQLLKSHPEATLVNSFFRHPREESLPVGARFYKKAFDDLGRGVRVPETCQTRLSPRLGEAPWFGEPRSEPSQLSGQPLRTSNIVNLCAIPETVDFVSGRRRNRHLLDLGHRVEGANNSVDMLLSN